MVEPLAGRDINTLEHIEAFYDILEYDTGERKVDSFVDVMVAEVFQHVPQMRIYRLRQVHPQSNPGGVDWWIRPDGMLVTRYWRPVEGWQSPWTLSHFGLSLEERRARNCA